MCAVTGKRIRGWQESVTGALRARLGAVPAPLSCAHGLGEEPKWGNMPTGLPLQAGTPRVK